MQAWKPTFLASNAKRVANGLLVPNVYVCHGSSAAREPEPALKIKTVVADHSREEERLWSSRREPNSKIRVWRPDLSMHTTKPAAVEMHRQIQHSACGVEQPINTPAVPSSYSKTSSSNGPHRTPSLGSLKARSKILETQSSALNSRSYEELARPRSQEKALDGLPRSPFLQPRDRRTANAKRIQEDSTDYGDFKMSIKRTLKKNIEQAPFSTAFHQNPFAHALAKPVREDVFTGSRVPLSCLLDFHIVESDKDAPESPALLPVSLAAELVPTKKQTEHKGAKMKPDEREAVMTWRAESESVAPVGSATYIISNYSAVRFVSSNARKYVPSLVISRRMREDMASGKLSQSLEWRDDMPEFVLKAMRKVIRKKLSWFLQEKKRKDSKGMSAEVPGDDLRRLNEVDDVGCVLQLRYAGARRGHREADGEGILQHQLEVAGNDTSDTSFPAWILEKAMVTDVVCDDLGSPIKTQSEVISSIPKFDDPSEFKSPPTAPLSSSLPARPTPIPHYKPLWSKKESSNLPFLTNLVPLPSTLPTRSPRYPTIPYRNRHIPRYYVPDLLGEEGTRKLLEGSVFEDSTYLTIGRGTGTIQAQTWLLKLQGYIAGDGESKGDENVVREA